MLIVKKCRFYKVFRTLRLLKIYLEMLLRMSIFHHYFMILKQLIGTKFIFLYLIGAVCYESGSCSWYQWLHLISGRKSISWRFFQNL